MENILDPIAPDENIISDESMPVEMPDLPEIEIIEKIFDREQAKTHLKIRIGDPYNTTVFKTGGLGRIAFQLVEQFSLPTSSKELAEVLAPKLADAAFHETSVEESLYYSLHSWLLEKGSDYFARGQMWWCAKNGNRYLRMMSEPLNAFFMAQRITDRKGREGILQHWRGKGWLNPGSERRLNKNIRVTLPDGSKGWVQAYEILMVKEEDLPVDDIEEAAPDVM